MKTDRELLKELETKLGIEIAITPNDVPLEKFYSKSQSTAAFSDEENLLKLSIINVDLFDVELLNNFLQLKILRLENCRLQNFESISKLNRLYTLSLSSNQIKDISPLNSLTQLSELNLSANQIIDISPLNSLTQLTKLYLRYNRIIDLSPLNSLTQLTKLYLKSNQIIDLSPLNPLTQLTILDLSSNQIIDVSPLNSLTHLIELYLNSNQIKDISPLNTLSHLTLLSLSSNQIKDISPLNTLSHLTLLSLSSNQIKDISPLNTLSHLTLLSLSSNQIKDISPLSSMTTLITLFLSYNQINDIEPLQNLTKLEDLILKYNNIRSIISLLKLPLLKDVELKDNPIEDAPQEVIEQGIDAIKNYFKQIDEQGQDYLCEAKILFVGQPGAGKTSLVKKLLDPDYIIPNQNEKETVGIEIKKWAFQTVKNDKSFLLTSHLWDFGGQLIQLAIHQFFYTSDSLYVLLADERKENTNFDYWFNIISLLGESSPILVVLNKKNNNTTFDFSLEFYRRRYNLVIIEEQRVDLSSNSIEWAALIEKIQTMAANIPIVGKPLPKQWVDIRKELEKHRSEHHLSYDKFFDICRQHRLINQDDQLLLLRTFHKLGICLHFENDPDLSDFIFIDMQWLVDGLYSILKNDSLGQNGGLITIAGLFNLYGNVYSEAEKRKLYLLMQKKRFDLCYPLDEENILFPSLLSVDRPKAVNVPVGKFILRFRYQFKFLPKGIIPRLIVRLHHLIDHDNFREQIWRHGLKFSYKDTSALCIEDIDKAGIKIIDITIASSDTEKNKALIFHLHFLIEEILKTYSNLPYNRMIACRCTECKTSIGEPHFFEENLLIKYKDRGIKEIRCPLSLENVFVLDLLNEVDLNNDEHAEDEREQKTSKDAQRLKRDADFENRYKNDKFVTKNVVIVHTDIVDHVTLNNKLGEEAMHEIRTAHFDAGEKILAEHDGTLIKTAGDALYIIFDDSISAIRFTNEFRKNPGDSRIKIRQVVCSGVVNLLENDFHGPTVSRNSRMAEHANANEIVISDEVKKDLDTIKPRDLSDLSWEPISGVTFKGFDDTKFNLWKNKL